jgi:hypothetical protein
MAEEQDKSPPTHTPAPWYEEELGESGNILITDEQGVTVATCWKQPLDPLEWVGANARLIVAAPKLLEALERAFDILDGIADTLLYEEGQPVTFLESREIEDIYNDAISELAPFETLIRRARGMA